MQAEILRKSNGHFTLLFSLAAGDAASLPDNWTHIELELGNLRILCPLPEHPRPEMFELRDPRLSSWLRAHIHSGKLKSTDGLNLVDVFEGVYRVERCQATSAPIQKIEEKQTQAIPVAVAPPKIAAARTSLTTLPRSVRRVSRQASIAACAS